MRIVGLAGWSGSGKTTLIEALIPCLAGRGLSASTLKHAHHGFQVDRPGKDSFRHRAAGAREVLLASDTGFALMGGAVADPVTLIGRMQPVDVLLIEGFGGHGYPTIEVHRPALGKPPMWTERAVAAVATDAPVTCALPVLDLNRPERIADWLLGDLPLLPARPT